MQFQLSKSSCLSIYLAAVMTANIYLLFACNISVEKFVLYRSSELVGVFALPRVVATSLPICVVNKFYLLLYLVNFVSHV